MTNGLKRTARALAALALTCLWASATLAQSVPPARTGEATPRIVRAANAFLATLDEAQRRSVQHAFDDDAQRKRWSNFPVSMVPRGGIALKDLSAAQRSAAMALLSSVLSPRGFQKVQEIMEGDEVLKANDRGGGRGNLMFGKDLYFLSFLGAPSETAPWMLQFGGHHLAVNVTIAGERGILTPTLTGAQPALFTLNGKTVRPLGQESDKALALLNALDEGQRAQAVLGFRVADLVLGPGEDDRRIQPEGLKASAMNDRQRAMLLDVIAEWSGIVHEGAAAARMAEIRAGLADTWFAWSGPTAGTPGQNIAAYYRIQGPNLVVEYAPQQMGGDPTLHVHTMYRDPTNDYGARLVRK
jgi:hypothetical protein